MRLTTLITSVVVAALTIASSVYASEFYPPERLNCKLTAANTFRCEGFDRQVLVEDVTNADLQKDKEHMFYFVSALGFYNQNFGADIIYTYYDSKSKMVKLRSIAGNLHPNINHGSWKKFGEELYLCDASYMRCGLTDDVPYSAKS